MRPEELTTLLRTRPFTPLRVHMTDGRTYDIRHPDQVLDLRGRIDIGIGPDPQTGVLDRVDHCSMLQVARVPETIAFATKPRQGPAMLERARLASTMARGGPAIDGPVPTRTTAGGL